jgi:UDP-N-acetylmuramoyl-L-alanyl-D-glutamate--2,6-diaminopimelate ligase
MARWFVDRPHERGIPSVSLRRLLPEARFIGCPDWQVSGCTDDHRRLDPGQVFVATRSARYDGHAFVREALERGAAGVIVEEPCEDAGRLQVVVADSHVALGRLCQALAGDPSRRLKTLSVTGTFGKTVTSLFMRSILEAAGLRCGLIGGLLWSDGKATRTLGAGLGGPPGNQTAPSNARVRRGPLTPSESAWVRNKGDEHDSGPWPGGAAGLASILAYMVDQRCVASILEVSAAAIEARCLEGIALQAAVVTDVGLPHGQPAELAIQNRRKKAKLFQKIKPGGLAVVNADDPHAEILGGVNLDARRISFGLEQPTKVDISARILGHDRTGSKLLLRGFDRNAAVALRLIGPRQVSCALAAAALAWGLNIDLDAVVAGLENVGCVAGSLESVDEGQEFDVRIDGAKTAETLDCALAALRSITAGRVVCVASAEGTTDHHTRRALAQVAEECADRVILTLGNPRGDDPKHLLDDLLGGFHRPGDVGVEPDRRRAIEIALAEAQCGDAVLIAGKGREAYQILADRVVTFDDFAVARACLRDGHDDNTQVAHRWA